MYDVGELSMMMVSLRSRPICDKSYNYQKCARANIRSVAYLDIISLVVVATFTEKSVVHNTVDIKLIEERVAVLLRLALHS